MFTESLPEQDSGTPLGDFPFPYQFNLQFAKFFEGALCLSAKAGAEHPRGVIQFYTGKIYF